MAHRFLYDLITSTMIDSTAVDVAQGRVTAGTKEKSGGGADGTPGGVFTGTTELDLVFEIDSVTAGTSIGLATFRYSIDGGLTWAQSGIATSSAATTITQGITFAFTAAATGDDFALGDRWRAKATLPFGVASLVDMQNRNSEWRSSTITTTKVFNFDFGTAGKQIRAAMLLDHNLSDRRDGGAQASVLAKIGATSPALTSQGQMPYHATSMGYFFAGGWYRYGRIEVTNTGNPNTYLRIGKLYLGDYLQLTGRMSVASKMPYRGDLVQRFGETATTPYGERRESIQAKGRVFALSYSRLKATAYAQLIALRDSVWDATTQRINRPLIFLPDHAVPSDAHLCYLTAFTPQRDHPQNNSVELELTEVLRRQV